MEPNRGPWQATIKEEACRENGYFYKVVTDDGKPFYLRGMGAPQGGKKGDRGTVTYQTGANFGLYFWSPDGGPR